MRNVALLKSGDYGDWASSHEGELPYRFDLIERGGMELQFTDRHLRAPFDAGVLARGVAAAERRLVPIVQTLLLAPRIRRADGVLAMFESEGHFFAALRAARFPGARRPVFAIVSCWLAQLIPEAGARKRAAYRRLYSNVDRLFVLSSTQVEYLEEALALPGRVRFVHFGIDHHAFSPETARNDGYVLAAGRDRGRDWATLFEAAARTGLPVKVLARPRDLDGFDVPHNVEVLGYRPFDEYKKLLLGARVVAVATHPRAYPTGQTVMLEAMSAAKAVVVTDTDAIRDYTAFDNCLTVLPHDPGSLAAAMTSAWNDAGLRARVGTNGRTFVTDTANAERMWSLVLAEMESVRR
jgi:glycosyltransferase involved in cell wall biosynthesis